MLTSQTSIVGLLNNYIFIIIKHMILYIFYFKDSVIRLYNTENELNHKNHDCHVKRCAAGYLD